MVWGGQESDHLRYGCMDGTGDETSSSGGRRFSRVLWGGRITKWKGRAASCAPCLAEVFAGAALRALPVLLGVGLTAGTAMGQVIIEAPDDSNGRTLYWKPDWSGEDLGGNGEWSRFVTGWNEMPDGTGYPLSWENGASAVFAGKPGTVVLGDGVVTVRDVIFRTGGYHITGDFLELHRDSSIYLMGTTVDATIERINVKESDHAHVRGGGTLTITQQVYAPGVSLQLEGAALWMDNSQYWGQGGGSIVLTGGVTPDASLVVTGPNGSVQAERLELGDSNRGGKLSVVVQDRAQVELEKHLYFAQDAGVESDVKVSGTGSRLQAPEILIHHQKNAVLEATGGGTIAADLVQVGEKGHEPLPGGTAALVNVSGAGSLLSARQLYIRHKNAAVWAVNGGRIDTESLQMGESAQEDPGVATIYVSGTGSTMHVAQETTLNYGMLTVRGGAEFETDKVVADGTGSISLSEGGRGAVNALELAGNSRMNVTDEGHFVTDMASISGTAQVEISRRGTLEATASLSVSDTSFLHILDEGRVVTDTAHFTGTARAEVAGGGHLQIERDLNIFGSGQIAILADGQLSARTTDLDGYMYISGGTFETSTAVIGQSAQPTQVYLSKDAQFIADYVSFEESSQIHIEEGGTFVATGFNANASAWITIVGDGRIEAVDANISGNTVISIAEGGRFHAASATLSGASQVYIAGEGSEFSLPLNGQLAIGGENVSITLYNGGMLRVPRTLTLASSNTESATLNIGGAFGQNPALGAGILQVSEISFGEGFGTINFNHTDTDYRFAPALRSGDRGIINHFAGETEFTGDSSAFLGTLSIHGGSVYMNNTLGGTVVVETGGLLGGNGSVGRLENAGIVAPGNSIGVLTVDGDYTGVGGQLEIETVLGDDSSETDRLVVRADTSGTTFVRVINLGGKGALTEEGIRIVEVGGESQGTFRLLGDYEIDGEPVIVAGAYAYRLMKNGISDPDDGSWYLRSGMGPTPFYQAGVPLYESYAGVLHGLNGPDTLQQRIGNRIWAAAGGQPSAQDGSGIWVRIGGAHDRHAAFGSTSMTSYKSNSWDLKAGADMVLFETEAGRLMAGVNARKGAVSARVSSPFGKGTIDTTGYGVGATLTWYGENGFYADGQAQFSWYESDLHSSTVGRDMTTDNKGKGRALSLEVGHRFALPDSWSVTPQAQVAYSSVDFDSFTDIFGAPVSLVRGEQVVGRLGVAVGRDVEWQDGNGKGRSNFYGIANLYYDFSSGSKVEVEGVEFRREGHALYGGLGLGGTIRWADGRYAFYGEADVRADLKHFGDSSAFSGTVGLRIMW